MTFTGDDHAVAEVVDPWPAPFFWGRPRIFVISHLRFVECRIEREVTMTAADLMRWLPMSSAPKDGSRILVAIRGAEQGPAEVDVVRWGKPKRADLSCWISTDSSHDCTILYHEAETVFWMPLPSSMPLSRTPGLAALLPEVPDAEADGSGI